MALQKSGTVARVLGFSLLLGGVACSALSEDEQGTSQDSALEAQFNRNNVITDAEISSSAMTVAEIQRFLEKTPYGTRSGLASFKENGKTAAEILHAEGLRSEISPIALLARLQMEQGLISKTTAPSATTDVAFGCGCPDSASCGPKYLGFANQAACAAGSLRRSIDKVNDGLPTVSGWKKGVSKKTQDEISIVPENAATAALYTYTPWVGESGGGKTGVGGTSLYFKVLKRFTDAYLISTGAGTGTADASTTEDASTTADTSTPPRDAGPVKDGGPCGCTDPQFPICDTASNTCVGCLQDTHCSDLDVCDTMLKKCVECTTGKLDNCDATDKGAACLPNKTCGCNTDSDCGSATSGRVCGTGKVCQEGCRGASGNKCPAGETCSSTSSAIGTCSGGGTDAGTGTDSATPPPPVDTDAGTEPPPSEEPPPASVPSDSDPDLEGHATPATNSAPPPQRNESLNSSFGTSAGPDLSLGSNKASSGGCNTGASSTGTQAGYLLGGLGVLVLAARRRRR